MSKHISQEDIVTTAEKIRQFIHKTPIMTSETLDLMTSAQLYFKCENLQKTGSFKVRGVTTVLLSLTEE